MNTQIENKMAQKRYKAGTREVHETVNPYTEKPIKKFTLMNEDESMAALESCHTAYLTWSETKITERVAVIKKFTKLLRENKEELAKLMTAEMGKVYSQGISEVERCVEICDYCIEEGPGILASEEKDYKKGRAIVSYRPQGVVLGIQPWNFPLYQVVRYSIPNVIAGNTVLLKHSKNVWGMAEKIAELFKEAGLPEYVFTPLYIDSKLVKNLIEHPYVIGVTLTGSEDAGKTVAEQAGRSLKKCVMELGGSDAYIVMEDADIEMAAKVCAQGRVGNNGQICTAIKRMIVVESVYDKFKSSLIKEMKDLQMGDPLEKTTKLGPLARKDLVDELHKQVQESLDAGAVCVTGGHRPKRTGYFYESTILENVSPGMPAYDDELFGPVASLIKVADLDEAIFVANDTKFGLGAGIFSKDEDAAVKIAEEQLEAGMCNVNGYSLATPHLPFGGIKNSGFGREHSHYGFREFVNVKRITISNK